MNTKSFLVLILSFGYFFFATWFYDQVVPGCHELKIDPIAEPIIVSRFSSKVTTTPNFEIFKKELLAKQSEDNILEITAQYFRDESSSNDDLDLGMMRAKKIRKLFPELPDESIRLKSLLVDDLESANDDLSPNVSFNWLTPPKKSAPIVEIGDQTTIYFDLNSTVGKIDPEIEKYLSKLSDILKNSEETITITGHTDSNGPAEVNQTVGLQRAQTIQNILLNMGVAPEKITVYSKGETEPVSSNKTEAGRAANRRTVIERIK